MKILVVHSGNHEHVAPFVAEQVEALREAGCDVQMYGITGHGLVGYIRNLKGLKEAIRQFKPDVVHAHYGICGLLCTLQHLVPVVVTYHGSDINDRRVLPLSRIAMRRADYNIFVSRKLLEKAGGNRFKFQDSRFKFQDSRFRIQDSGSKNNNSQLLTLNSQLSIIPCGVDTNLFHLMQRDVACKVVNLDPTKRYILFAGAFDVEVKNPELAKATCEFVPEAILLELKGYSREQVAALMNVADALLMTSHREGSPQVIKEALACGLPIVSVDVGDVKERTEGVAGCYVAKNYNAEELADLLNKAIEFGINNERKKLLKDDMLDNRHIALKLIKIYKVASNNSMYGY